MVNIIKEHVTNHRGISWLRTHAMDNEGRAMCWHDLTDESADVSTGKGSITCCDCIATIDFAKRIGEPDIDRNYDSNPVFTRQESPKPDA